MNAAELPRPPRHLQDDYDAIFSKSGQWQAIFFQNRLGITPASKILDVGCGSGRHALALVDFISADAGGEYFGFDVMQDRIQWCIENISSRYSNFHFSHVDIHSEYFNPVGKRQIEEFRFPYPDENFDLVIFWSVFSHILPEVSETYVREAQRVLKPGRPTVLTCYLWTKETQQEMDQGDPLFQFPYVFEHFRARNQDTPEEALAYSETYFEDLFRRNHFSQLMKRLGSWRSQPNYDQDLLVFLKNRKNLVEIFQPDAPLPRTTREGINPCMLYAPETTPGLEWVQDEIPYLEILSNDSRDLLFRPAFDPPYCISLFHLAEPGCKMDITVADETRSSFTAPEREEPYWRTESIILPEVEHQKPIVVELHNTGQVPIQLGRMALSTSQTLFVEETCPYLAWQSASWPWLPIFPHEALTFPLQIADLDKPEIFLHYSNEQGRDMRIYADGVHLSDIIMEPLGPAEWRIATLNLPQGSPRVTRMRIEAIGNLHAMIASLGSIGSGLSDSTSAIPSRDGA